MKSAVLLLLLGTASQTWAATVSYVLDQANILEDGQDYMTVTVMDREGERGGVDIWVEAQPVLLDQFCDGASIYSFAFDISRDIKLGDELTWMPPDGPGHPEWSRERREQHESGTEFERVLTRDAIDLPEGWWARLGGGVDFPGRHDIYLTGERGSNDGSLHFSIDGLSIADIGTFFVARLIGGMDGPAHGCPGDEGGCVDMKVILDGGRKIETGPNSEVPVPPAMLLFVSGLLAAAGVGRRQGQRR